MYLDVLRFVFKFLFLSRICIIKKRLRVANLFLVVLDGNNDMLVVSKHELFHFH